MGEPTPEPVAPGDGAPARDLERCFARVGLLDEARPIFVSGREVPGVGALMALALVSKTALFEAAQELYGRLKPAFYGLENVLRVLCLMATLRIKRPQGLTSQSPSPLGRVLGLDRLPEVKTLRRKLNEIAAHARASDFVARMATAWAGPLQDTQGILFVDGHVRVYHGQRKIPKA